MRRFILILLQGVSFTIGTSKDYAPHHVKCTAQFVRPATKLSEAELKYIEGRQAVVKEALKEYLSETGFDDFDVPGLFAKTGGIPNVAVALSGGSLRAMTFGGAVVRALDSRTVVGTGTSTLGGLLQGSTYITGLSGGSWLVASMVANDWPTVDTLKDKFWSIQDVGKPPPGNWKATYRYYKDIFSSIQTKMEAGFRVTMTDLWGRILSYHVLDRATGMTSTHWSQVVDTNSFKNFLMPYPILLSVFRPQGQDIVPLDAPVFEMTPHETGSWDAPFQAFTPTRFLGTQPENGAVVHEQDCIEGYDNIGFMIGTSASLFCAIIRRGIESGFLSKILASATHLLQTVLDKDDMDVARFPNPFQGLLSLPPKIKQDPDLTLVDGGLAGQNIPLWPLLQPERKVDIILASDATSDDKDNWPNGEALIATYQRATDKKYTHRKPIPMAVIPDQETFVKHGLHKTVTFFGCEAKDSTMPNEHTPLIVYIPNNAHQFMSNYSTFDLMYSEENIKSTFANGLAIATFDESAEFRIAMSCAIMKRSLERTGMKLEVCETYFEKYCWSKPSSK
ncbi:lysophospholipase [Protomyces lactucae-debilis]|uniref:Lysophospholipase n=1 Tax=Protomyces lactucae-debilis TaxID=2754530 RepID=A0A1Y2FSV3_PROLT|nr:lysophospholipase [Protomyces lactucae-debilis]ORY86266.1 lysophospholipase [Protomyces lactucae-debilis]